MAKKLCDLGGKVVVRADGIERHLSERARILQNVLLGKVARLTAGKEF